MEAEPTLPTDDSAGLDLSPASLDEFQELLDSTEKPADAPEPSEQVEDDPHKEGEEETEQPAGDDDPADEATDDPPAESAKTVEGPSAAMQYLARLNGVREDRIARAANDAELQLAINVAEDFRASQNESASREQDLPEDLELKFSLPEDEFGADDPVAKQLRHVVDTVNKRMAQMAQIQTALMKDATMRMEADQQRQYGELYGEFDKALDSYQHPDLGSRSKATPAQLQLREQIAQRYHALGATPDMPAAEKQRLATLAVMAVRQDITAHRASASNKTRQQPRTVLGGNGGKPVERPRDPIDEFQQFLDGRISREALLNNN